MKRLISIDTLTRYIMDITEALDALKAHAERKANSAYRGGDGLAYLDWHPTERKAVSRFNIIKYLTRYSAHKGDKAANPDDLLKLAHYALLEWQKATAADVELTPEPDPQHTIHGTCIIDMGRTIRVRCEIDGKSATLEARITGRWCRFEDRIDGLPVTVRGHNLRYDAAQRMWLLDDCMIAGVDLEPQLSDVDA